MKKQNNIPANNYSNMNDNDLIMLARQKDDHALEILISRYRSSMVKAALHHFRKYPFDEDIRAMSPYDQEFALLSEIYIAFEKAIRRFNFERASFKSFASNCIMWHFADLYRDSVNHAAHEKLMSSFESHKYDDDEIEPEDYLQYEAAMARHNDESRNVELRDAFECAMCYVPNNSIEMRVLRELSEDLDSDKRLSIASVAVAINRSRQQVYNILQRILENLPEVLAREIREQL